jgi:hypothetical protein
VSTNHQPQLRAYTVIKREGQDDYWMPIGAAFEHKTLGTGYNLILQALPLPDKDGVCKIVLRPPKDNEAAEAAGDNVRSLDRNKGGNGRQQRSRS